MDKAIESAKYLKQFCHDSLEAKDCGNCPFASGETEWGKPRKCKLKSTLPPFTWKVGDEAIETVAVL